MKKAQRFSLINLFCWSGWGLAILLTCFILPHLYGRLFLKLPSVQSKNWASTMARKAGELTARWKDSRPLIIMAGDSHIEKGDWYELFDGAFAIRNCGLSCAKISDVADLIPAIADKNSEAVVLMCGVNNLGANDSVASCLTDYERLVREIQVLLHPQKIIVLSIMPVRETAIDATSHQLNQQILSLNRGLEKMCTSQRIRFLDLTGGVTGKDGGLSAELTADGLHLNREGYKKIVTILAPVLSRPD